MGAAELPQNLENNKIQVILISLTSKPVGLGMLFSIKEVTEPSFLGSQKLLATTFSKTKKTNTDPIIKTIFLLFITNSLCKLFKTTASSLRENVRE